MGAKKSDPWKWLAIGISIITLPGIVDDIVTWKEWFEIGWMHHWRALKLFILINFFWWVPFKAPPYFVEYILLGAVFIRSAIAAMREIETLRELSPSIDKLPKVERRMLRRIIYSNVERITIISVVLRFCLWPIYAINYIIKYLRYGIFGKGSTFTDIDFLKETIKKLCIDLIEWPDKKSKKMGEIAKLNQSISELSKRLDKEPLIKEKELIRKDIENIENNILRVRSEIDRHKNGVEATMELINSTILGIQGEMIANLFEILLYSIFGSIILILVASDSLTKLGLI